MEMTAPSGKFWMAMPMASAIAPAAEIAVSPESIPANTTPTAMPSGILCSVTANTSMAERPSVVCGPSGLSESMCRCGMISSSKSRKPMPSRKPAAAGSHSIPPCAAVSSIAGMSSDQTDAAIITPEAKPSRAFCRAGFISPLRKNAIAAPSVVPAKGISRPSAVVWVNVILFSLLRHISRI